MKNYIFYIHMQMIVDGLVNAGISCTLHNSGGQSELFDIRFFRGQKEFRKDFLYIAHTEELSGYIAELQVTENQMSGNSASAENQMPGNPAFTENHTGSKDKNILRFPSALILLGDPIDMLPDEVCSYIQITEAEDIFQVYEAINEVFYRARTWNGRMQNILNNQGSLEDLCETAEQYFRNPLFIHNPNFYILACKTHYDNMDPWQKDERTGLPMLSAELINGFKMNPEYLDTLDKVGTQIFPIDSTGYRVMYVNLWDEYGRYEGRICIDELQTAFQPGQMPALEFFGRMAMVLIKQRDAQKIPFEKPLENMITDMVSGKSIDPDYMEGILDTQGWKVKDTYRVFKMELDWRDRRTSSIINTCNHIEGTIDECHAIHYENSILVILNITKTSRKKDEIMQILNRIIRETILKTGISNTFNDFSKLMYFHQQASLALQYGMQKNPAIWIHRFENYVMDYCCDMVCREIPAEFICAPAVIRLREHDKEKHTELYETLKTYLKCFQNAEQTAKTLYIHRSTLFYRLKKIKEVSGLDLNEPENMFYIQFSIHLIEQGV